MDNSKKRKVMKAVYKVKPTKKQLKIINEYWKQLMKDHYEFLELVSLLELNMSLETGIEDLEFIMCDNEFVGCGNVDRTMELIQLQ